MRLWRQRVNSCLPSIRSPVAQLVEQAAVNRLVAGSSPARGATRFFTAALVELTSRGRGRRFYRCARLAGPRAVFFAALGRGRCFSLRWAAGSFARSYRLRGRALSQDRSRPEALEALAATHRGRDLPLDAESDLPGGVPLTSRSRHSVRDRLGRRARPGHWPGHLPDRDPTRRDLPAQQVRGGLRSLSWPGPPLATGS